MKYTTACLLVILFLTSCAAPATVTPVPAQIPTQTFTPYPTATQTTIPTSTITPLPTQIGGGSGKLLFSYGKDQFMEAFPDLQGETNIFVADVDGTNLAPITNGLEGYNYVTEVSPDGTKLLIVSTSERQNKTASLYWVDLSAISAPVSITDSVPYYYGHDFAAKWLDSTSFVYVGQGNSGFGIYKMNVDTMSSESVYQYNNEGEEYRPFEILALDIKNSRIYWDTHGKAPGLAAMYDVYNVWWSSLEGNSERTPLEFNGKQLQFTNNGLVFSPDGTRVAWIEETIPPSLHVAATSDIDNPHTVETISPRLRMTWFPDSSKIIVFDEGSLGYGLTCEEEPAESTSSDVYGVYEVSVTPTLSITNYHLPAEKLMTCESWGGNANYSQSELHDISPDSRQILFEIRRRMEAGPNSKINFLDVETLSFSEASNSTFSNIEGAAYWIP